MSSVRNAFRPEAVKVLAQSPMCNVSSAGVHLDVSVYPAAAMHVLQCAQYVPADGRNGDLVKALHRQRIQPVAGLRPWRLVEACEHLQVDLEK